MSSSGNQTHTVEFLVEERVTVSDGLVFVSGLTAADPEVGIPAQAAVSPEFPYYGADIQRQTTYILEKLSRLLESVGANLEAVVKTQVFLTDCRLFDAFDQVWKRFFPMPPPRTTVGVGSDAMPVPGALVSVDVIAAQPEVLAVTQVDSPRLPKPLANYTPCVAAGDWLFLAGQLPTEFGVTGLAPAATVNPNFPHHVSPLVAQATFTLGICTTLLEDAGTNWDQVVRVHVFLKNVADAPLFEALWNDMFDAGPPPSLVIGVDELLTGGALIEVDVIAIRAATPKQVRTAPDGTVAVGANATLFAVAQAGVVEHAHRVLAVEAAVTTALSSAGEAAGDGARPVKLHVFLPHPQDTFGFGRGLDSVAEAAAVATSPSVGATGVAMEIVYRAES